MKTKFLPVIISAALTGYSTHANAQVNKSLSNLKSPTAVNQSLIPNQDFQRDLGSATLSWRDLYLASTIYFSHLPFIAIPPKSTGGCIAIGYSSLRNTTGQENIAIGSSALFSATSGRGNTALGGGAGTNVTTGSNNTFIGVSSNCGSGGTLSNSTAIGSGATVATSNAVRVGSSFVTSIGGFANWSNISDGRVKKNIKINVPGLAFINKLKPVTYNLDLDAADNIIARPPLKDKDGITIPSSQEELTARKEKEQIIYSGFVAQDVEKAAKELDYDFSGVDAAKNEHDLYSLRYADFVVPLVKAVQELSQKNDELQKQIDELKAIINSKQLANTQQANVSSPVGGVEGAALFQNIPNPFNHTTTINYTLPQKFSAAKIVITDNSGKTLKQINISGAGEGSVNVNASTLAQGAYNYSLIVDGKLIGTKHMVLMK